MAKQVGFPAKIQVDDSGGVARDISNDVTGGFGISTPRNQLTVPGLDKSAEERLQALADGTVTLTGTFNPASDKSHDVFKSLANVRTVTIAISDDGNAVSSGDPELEMEMLVANYDLSRGADGGLTWTATLNLADGTVPSWGTVA